MVSATSLATAAISMASTPSVMRSPAPTPTIPTPSTRSVCGIDEELGHAFGTVEGEGAARSCPGKLGNFDFAVFLLRLRLGEAAPGNFRIGENHRRNGARFEGDLVAGNGFGGGPALVRGFVRQHGFSDHIADGVDGGIVGLQLLVDLDEAARPDFDCGLLQAGDVGIGFASDRDQNLVEDLFRLRRLGRSRLPLDRPEGHANSVGFFFHRPDGGVEQNGVEDFFHPLVQGKHQVAVRSGQ